MMWTKLTPLGSRRVGLRGIATSSAMLTTHCCRILILGGGCGGTTLAAKFSKQFKNSGDVIVVDPACDHYYQPLFTLIGAGIKKLSESVRPMDKVLPKTVCWLRDEVEYFDPKNDSVSTTSGDQISYEFCIVAMGITLHYEKIKGLQEALSEPCTGVCSIYSPKYVEGVFEEFKAFHKGNAIFTQPANHIKCAGAPQKIAYLFEHYLRKKCQRANTEVIFNTAQSELFSSKHYADALWKVANNRNIIVNLCRNLVEVKHNENIAIFQDVAKPDMQYECEYSLLHVTPPQCPPKALIETKVPDLVDSTGYLNVCPGSLQHVTYKNIFGIGDCTNAPTSKTAAAIAAQNGVVFQHITAMMCGKPEGPPYDGYTACPLVTSYGTVMLAEFDYDKEPLETMPYSQATESTFMYSVTTKLLPYIYWEMQLKGKWDGPKPLRDVFHIVGKKKGKAGKEKK